jgi:hypothetical protein
MWPGAALFKWRAAGRHHAPGWPASSNALQLLN